MSEQFVKVSAATFRAMDPYRRLPEFDAEREEPLLESANVTTVGPFVVEPTRRTAKVVADVLPAMMANLGFMENPSGVKFLSVGSTFNRHDLQVKGRVIERDGQIVANTVDWGEIVIRPMTPADADLLDSPDVTKNDDEAALTRFYFSGNKESLDEEGEE